MPHQSDRDVLIRNLKGGAFDTYENLILGNFLFGLGLELGLNQKHAPVPSTLVDLHQQYDARHTFATRHGVNHKTSLPVLAALLGHSDITKLKIYIHPSQEDMNAAMKASDLELGQLA